MLAASAFNQLVAGKNYKVYTYNYKLIMATNKQVYTGIYKEHIGHLL